MSATSTRFQSASSLVGREFPICIRKYNWKFTFFQMKAHGCPSFRKFLLEYETIVTRRMTREQRIMIDAFEIGDCDYRDVVAPESRMTRVCQD